MKVIYLGLLISIFLTTEVFANDTICDLPWGDPNCECCSENWSGWSPPEEAYIVFQDVERTNCDPNWIMLPAPNNRLFILEYTGGCSWGYKGDESDIWIITLNLNAPTGRNIFLANTFDDNGSDMIYFVRRGRTDCRTVYVNELQSWDCEPFVNLWAGGTARIFWHQTPTFGDFNGDGTVDFKDYAILVKTPGIPNEVIRKFAENWLEKY